MAPDVAPVERLAEVPASVDPVAIEQEFDRVWRESSAGSGPEGAVLRLRVLNLVAIGEGEGDRDRFDAIMQSVPVRHPGRAILTLAEPSLADLSANISARCWRVGGARHICSEEVRLQGPARDDPALASAALALLVPDLPLAVWLMSGTPERYLARELIEHADRVIVDGSAESSPVDMWRGLRELRDEYGFSIGDLAWERLSAWRELGAQVFDADVARLTKSTAVEIAGRPAEGALYAGWLASRLSLSLADVDRGGGSVRATYYAGTRPVRIVLTRAATSIARVKFEAGTVCTIERDPVQGHIRIIEGSDEESRRVVEDRPEDEAAQLGSALDIMADDPILEEAVEAALPLLDA